MYSVIIDNNLEKESSKKRSIKVNFGKIYLFLLIFCTSLIYFYSVYENNYLSILIPYRLLWPISVIFIGVSILRAKNTAAFSIGFFITTLSVGITITSFFVYSSNIQNNNFNTIVPNKDASGISSNIELVSTKADIKSEDVNIFKGESISNYDEPIFSNYRDENNIENIKLEQKLFPPGIGSYTKNTDVVFPTNTPISFNINSNLSDINIELSDVNLKSSYIKANTSNINMVIKDVNLEEEVILDINSNLSIINMIISKDIPIIVSSSSGLSQVELSGLENMNRDSSIYQTINQYNLQNQNIDINDKLEENSKEIKKLVINIKSTLSQVKITQK
jgi:hypothetical protein